MSTNSNNREALEILTATLEENPDLWETRKKTAKLLFEDKRYLEAADILWSAPEIPATDTDVAFTLTVISRVKPNRSIRLIYEILRRNKGKPLKNIAVAKSLNNSGLYMEAARFYGAAVAEEPKVFNIAFERQMLWMDDSKRLIEEWMESDQEAKIPLNITNQELPGGMIRPSRIHNEIDQINRGGAKTTSSLGNRSSGATEPLVAPQSAPRPMQQHDSYDNGSSNGHGQSVNNGGEVKTAKPNPFLSGGATSQSTTKQPANQAQQQPGQGDNRITRPLLVAGSSTPPEAPQTRSLIAGNTSQQQQAQAAQQQQLQAQAAQQQQAQAAQQQQLQAQAAQQQQLQAQAAQQQQLQAQAAQQQQLQAQQQQLQAQAMQQQQAYPQAYAQQAPAGSPPVLRRPGDQTTSQQHVNALQGYPAAGVPQVGQAALGQQAAVPQQQMTAQQYQQLQQQQQAVAAQHTGVQLNFPQQ